MPLKRPLETDVILGGDPTIIRAALRDPAFAAAYHRTEAARSIEVPCQFCGRLVLLAPSGQRIALGMPERVVELDVEALLKDRVAGKGETFTATGGAAVCCVFCAMGDDPAALAKLEAGLADAKRKLGEASKD